MSIVGLIIWIFGLIAEGLLIGNETIHFIDDDKANKIERAIIGFLELGTILLTLGLLI